MKPSPLPAPQDINAISLPSDSWPSSSKLGLVDDHCHLRQTGGRQQALNDLNTFLNKRGEHYTKAMSSPVLAYDACSRLSAHFAFGSLSIREAFHLAEQRQQAIKALPRGEKGEWSSAMRSFLGRLRWHCHFIQKLEDEPSIEFRNLHSGYDALRSDPPPQDIFQAWATGMTGFPMVDACMRSLISTGWLNFRMRAMLVSFASMHLFMHWRETSLHLARLFTDYEPGIHYSQIQMQSGTTGINAIRIYSPTKQAIDQDPNGIFIRKWIPELADMPDHAIHTPWIEPTLLNGYPMPMVDEAIARKEAARKLYAIRKRDENRVIAKKIAEKHASRKPNRRSAKPRRKKRD